MVQVDKNLYPNTLSNLCTYSICSHSEFNELPKLFPNMIIIKSESLMRHQTIPPPEWSITKKSIGDYPLVYECWKVHFLDIT
jgi:hypothetical protein